MMMSRPFKFSAFYGIDGSMLFNDRWEVATEEEFLRWLDVVEPELDRLTMEMCKWHRARGERLEEWQLKAEYDSFMRTRKRV